MTHVLAFCLIATALVACGGNSPSQSSDAMSNTDAVVDAGQPDHPDADAGSDANNIHCLVPNDCLPGLTCCLKLTPDSGAAVVSCEVSCVPDATTTWLACATDADCPATGSKCVFLAPTNRGDFNICE